MPLASVRMDIDELMTFQHHGLSHTPSDFTGPFFVRSPATYNAHTWGVAVNQGTGARPVSFSLRRIAYVGFNPEANVSNLRTAGADGIS